MDFGRIINSEEVDYTLPADHSGVVKVLGGIKTKHPAVYAGGVLWSDESFKGTIYPLKAKASDYVNYYTTQFNTIELNATHYRVPDEKTFKRWLKVAPEGFKFCPKINKEISHANHLLSMLDFHDECNRLFALLENKLGHCFLQLPPHFSPERSSELIKFLGQSQPQNLAVELRHKDWFNRGEELNLLCNYLYKNNKTLVLTDTPGRRDVLHMRLTSKTAFVRFNAINNIAIDQQRIDEWIGRAKTWFDLGLETFYFFAHSPGQIAMPFLTTYFIERLQKMCDIKLSPPVINEPDKKRDQLF